MNKESENNLSSVKIMTKVEMKTGKRYTEWDIKAKHEDVFKANAACVEIDKQLREQYGST